MSLDWRNFSDEQWLRVAEGSGSQAAALWRPTASSNFRHRARLALLIVAPLLMCAAYLALSGRPDVQARPAAKSALEGDAMNWMAASGVTAALAISMMGSAQNLLTNGGLEGSLPAACNGFTTLSGGSTTIPGWTVSATNSVDWFWSQPSGTCCDSTIEGNRHVDLNGSPAQNGSALRQTIATTPGRTYRVSVLARANGCCSSIGTTKVLQITAGSVVTEHALTVDGLSDCDPSNWTRIESDWVAGSAVSMIELRSLVPSNAGGPLVDDISVVEIGPRDLRVPAEYPSLSAAVAASQPGDRVLIAPGSYPWDPIVVPHDLAIESTGGAMSTRFVGGGTAQSYLVECAPGAEGSVRIVGLHVSGGRGLHLSSGSLELRNCLFSDNLQGVLIESEAPFGSASVVDCAFVRNGVPGLAQAGGFGIYTTQSKGASFERCVFIANQAGEGGGLHLSHSTSTITDCSFIGNSATVYSGGAIARWWGHAGVPTVRSTFVGNSAVWGGTANWNCCIECFDCQFTTTADYSLDCDLNLIPDLVEMGVDPSVDADSNGVLDRCEAPPCLGDLDGSNTVTGVDLAIVLQNWGVPSAKYPGADIDGDGLVGGTDLSIVLSSWGNCP